MSHRLFAIGLVSLFTASAAWAGSTDNHTVTVTVSAINEVSIAGGAVVITISSATPGADPDDVTDNTTADLDWTTNEASRKITVQTDLVSPVYGLTTQAQGVTGGVSAGVIAVSTSPQDFVTGISATTGSCDLSYTGSATAGDAPGSEVHTITYTITGA
jgi:hypothetical protein